MNKERERRSECSLPVLREGIAICWSWGLGQSKKWEVEKGRFVGSRDDQMQEKKIAMGLLLQSWQ